MLYITVYFLFLFLNIFARHSSDSGFQSLPPSRPLSRRSSLFSLGSSSINDTSDSDEEFMSHVKVYFPQATSNKQLPIGNFPFSNFIVKFPQVAFYRQLSIGNFPQATFHRHFLIDNGYLLKNNFPSSYCIGQLHKRLIP